MRAGEHVAESLEFWITENFGNDEVLLLVYEEHLIPNVRLRLDIGL